MSNPDLINLLKWEKLEIVSNVNMCKTFNIILVYLVFYSLPCLSCA